MGARPRQSSAGVSQCWAGVDGGCTRASLVPVRYWQHRLSPLVGFPVCIALSSCLCPCYVFLPIHPLDSFKRGRQERDEKLKGCIELWRFKFSVSIGLCATRNNMLSEGGCARY